MAIIFKRSNAEKRSYERKGCYFLVKYRYSQKGESYSESVTSLRNISGGGLLLKSKEFLPIGSKLELKINIVPLGLCVDATAQVVRIEKIRGKLKTGYLAGVVFMDIKEEDRKKIIDFVEMAKELTD
ncbi:MAG: PilZ domain-containing protein [Candidatus Omnitrophica bacterium]|nr:PilZ domain-containing protein [Candidatus Omnitrophota bacterium]